MGVAASGLIAVLSQCLQSRILADLPPGDIECPRPPDAKRNRIMRTILTCLTLFLALPAQAEAPQRVVTIGGALTETVYALEAKDLIVGSDTTSYYPPAADKLPKVGYQRTLSTEGILSLNPDLVILTEEAGPPSVLRQLESAGAELLILKAGRSLEDVKTNTLKIAQALNREETGAALIRKIDVESRELAHAVAGLKHRKRVMFILQHGGGAPMVAGKGTAADSIIALSGAVNVVQDYDGYKPLSPEAAVALRPDVILITKRGLEQAGGKDSLLKTPGLSLTPAARQGHVVAMDALLMLGFGPRTVQAASELSQAYEGP